MPGSHEDRIAALESELAVLKSRDRRHPGSKDGWDKFDILAKVCVPTLSALVLLAVVYLVKDSVDLALRREQLEVDSAQGMENLLGKLRDPQIKPHEAEGAVLALAAYGRLAVLPLINELDTGSTFSKDAAEKGLFLIGLVHADSTCPIFERVLNNQDQQFTWSAHLRIIRLLGNLGCRSPLESLETYDGLVRDHSPAGRDAYAGTVRGRLNVEDILEIKEELDRALQLLKRD